MPIVPYYAQVKDKYCIAYFGHCNECIVQLKLLRPQLETQFPGVHIYLACRDEALYLLAGQERILGQSRLRKEEFGYVRELLNDMQSNPVEAFLEESGVRISPIKSEPPTSGPAIILTHAVLPNQPLTPAQVVAATNHVRKKGSSLAVGDKWQSAAWVLGPENAELYEAAAAGRKVTLIPTGFGEKLFVKMFPRGEILRLSA